ncbi:MAG TPA: hypothetical protein DD381_11185 [Lentisphaeria bacterium]|nr:hypothetical protein [Lentisphaeria bacterium]
MEKAIDLLSASSLPVKDISCKLGFDNPFHFSRVFKRYFGKSPKMLRNETLKNNHSTSE